MEEGGGGWTKYFDAHSVSPPTYVNWNTVVNSNLKPCHSMRYTFVHGIRLAIKDTTVRFDKYPLILRPPSFKDSIFLAERTILNAGITVAPLIP